MEKVCFVISPIGDEGSPVRTAADDLFDIVISPVLKAHGFDVVRADKIPGSGTIGDQIVELIQNATLCVIDLTGHNANVYYECGRRHETGKPFIQLMKKGERLPFDLAGIRTIFYELETARLAHEASEELERFVQEFERTGYSNESAGISLGTLATAVARIDRKVDDIRDGMSVGTRAAARSALTGGLESLLASPWSALKTAIDAGNLEGVRALFPRIRSLGIQSEEYVISANILASNGDDEGLDALEQLLLTSTAAEKWKAAVGGIRRYASIRHQHREILERFEPIIAGMVDDALALPDSRDRAFIANQIGIMAENAENYEQSVQYARRAIDMAPDVLGYRVNLAIALERYDVPEALRVVETYMSIPGAMRDSHALREAIDVYVAADMMPQALATIDALEEVDSAVARLKRRSLPRLDPAE